mgnify:CR=1 FL=1
MGVSVAYHLARLGMQNIVLLEREQLLGAGSTGKCAGGARLQFSSESNIRLSLESIDILERFEDELGQSIDFRQDGYMFLLSEASTLDTFRKNFELQRRLGVPVEWLDVDEACRRAPGMTRENLRAATFCGRDGIADPNSVTMGFAKAAQRLGVTIEREVEVIGIGLDADRITEIQTSAGPIETRIVVNAAGPWSHQIGQMVGTSIPVQPFRRHIFIADVLKPLVVQGANGKVLDDKDKNFSKHVYWPLRHQFGFANSNFATTYGNWAKVYDTTSDTQIWIPFSGVAAKIYANNDANFARWYAPAGFNRGVVTGVNDIAVSATQRLSLIHI